MYGSIISKPSPGRLLDLAHPLSRGLVGFWLLGDGGARANDSTGKNNHGILTSFPVNSWVGGPSGGSALRFDGAASYIPLPSMAARFTTEATVVLEVRLRLHTPVDDAKTGLISLGVGSLPRYPYVDGTIYCDYFSNIRKTVGVGLVTDRTQWHQVAVTSTPGANGWRFYQNGQLYYLDTGDSTISLAPVVEIGRHNNGGSNYELDGDLNFVRLYNRSLSNLELLQLKADPYAGFVADDQFLDWFAPAAAGGGGGDTLWAQACM